VNLNLSIDGIDEIHEYIRFPVKWHVMDKNIRMLRELPNAEFCVTPVVQIYNAMNLVELCRYSDNLRMGLTLANVLHWPEQLRISLMPKSALQVAAERLRKFADADCSSWNQHQVRSLAQHFESLPGKPSPQMFRKFMLFTNDLDISRGQSFKSVHHELYRAFQEAGYEWTDETQYARRPTKSHAPISVAAG
jgi:hypothetical protein